MKKEKLIYGIHAVACALQAGNRKINRVYATKNGANNLSKIVNLDKYQAFVTSSDVISEMLPEGAVHQGVALDCEGLPGVSLDEMIAKAGEKSVVVILDQVSDPHNIGAIIRSTAAFGADGVIMQEKNSPELTGIVAKVACGGIEKAPLIRVVNLARAIETLQEKGYWVIGLDERGKCDLSQTGLTAGKIAIVLGAEGPGIRPLILKKCDVLAKIPMVMYSKVTSINVSNAAAVALYEFFRK